MTLSILNLQQSIIKKLQNDPALMAKVAERINPPSDIPMSSRSAGGGSKYKNQSNIFSGRSN